MDLVKLPAELGSVTPATNVPVITLEDGMRVVYFSSNGIYTGSALGDEYLSEHLPVKPGRYNIHVYALKYVYDGIATFEVVRGRSIKDGLVNDEYSFPPTDLYSATKVSTMLAFKDIVVASPGTIRLKYTITSKFVGSLGYRISLGDIILVRQ
jgi:hypothetical protein